MKMILVNWGGRGAAEEARGKVRVSKVRERRRVKGTVARSQGKINGSML